MQALILIPVYSEIIPPLQQALTESQIPWLPLRGSSDLPKARSLLFTQALMTSAERVICLDADIVATADQLRQMAEDERVTPYRAVTGLYTVRSLKSWACHARDLEAPASRDFFQANFAGLGCAAIATESLRRVAETLPWLQEAGEEPWKPFCCPRIVDKPGGGQRYEADDVSLWGRLAETGTELWADKTRVVGHYFSAVFFSPR